MSSGSALSGHSARKTETKTFLFCDFSPEKRFVIMSYVKVFRCTVIAVCCFLIEGTTVFNNAIDSAFSRPLASPFNPPLGLSNSLGLRQSINPSFSSSFGSLSGNTLKRRCPLCDSSVYSYCTEKLFHDSCCCHNPDNPYDQLPYQCQFADCSFLHANTCREHKLITACCCTNYLFYRK